MTVDQIAALVRSVPDFPKQGILFRDLSPVMADERAIRAVAEELVKSFDLNEVDAFVGIESRGFILAAYLAGHFGKGFIALRKAGKLPPPVHRQSYALEYGQATLEMTPKPKTSEGRVVIIDDVLATGGTLQAAIDLCEISGYTIQGCAVVIDLPKLNQMRFRDKPIHSVLQF